MFGKFALLQLDAMDPGTLFVDHTTASALVAQEMAVPGARSRLDLSTRQLVAGKQALKTASLRSCVVGSQNDYHRARSQ